MHAKVIGGLFEELDHCAGLAKIKGRARWEYTRKNGKKVKA